MVNGYLHRNLQRGGVIQQRTMQVLRCSRLVPPWWRGACVSSTIFRNTTVHIHALQMSSSSSDLRDIPEFFSRFVNYESSGIPTDAGTSRSSCFNLDRMHRLLARLGDPHTRIPAVHVAGSKGKGSVSTMLAHILQAAGLNVGLYTSPHLMQLGERIASTSLYPTPKGMPLEQLHKLISLHRPQLEAAMVEEQGTLSQFEVMTALAFRHFADANVDIAVLETGLGGETDATNVIPSKCLEAAVITPLGMEHVAALGGSLHSIATAKAGISKPGRPVIISHQPHPEACQVVVAHARQLSCAVTMAEDLVAVDSLGWELSGIDQSNPSPNPCAARERVQIRMLSPGCTRPFPPPPTAAPMVPYISTLSSIKRAQSNEGSSSSPVVGPLDLTPWELPSIRVSLGGPHQHGNMATAVSVAWRLAQAGWAIQPEHVATGLQKASVQGRFQVAAIPGPPPHYLVLDGAHTEHSAQALAASLHSLFPPSTPIALIIAMASDKAHREVLAALRGVRPKVVIFTTVAIAGDSSRAASPGTLAADWQAAGMMSKAPHFRSRELILASMMSAYDRACGELQAFPGQGVVCITGSLYAVAEANRLGMLRGP